MTRLIKKAVFAVLLTFVFFSCQKIVGVSVSNITLDKESLTLLVGDSKKMTVIVYPANATNKSVVWSSTDMNVVSIDATGTLSAKALGTAIITAMTVDGSKNVSCSVRVGKKNVLYGLGDTLWYERSNNVNYEWYIDQVNTGQYAYVNCGPASVTMVIKWSNQNFSKTTEDARKTYRSEGGWWYTSDIVNYLKNNNTAHYISDVSSLQSQLDQGSIAILCLDMYYVRQHLGDSEWRIDKFYVTQSPEWGHFIVVKGYKKVDGKIWYEIYDPWSLNVKYMDGSLKGRNRYYRSEDIMQATNVWWPYTIVINGPKSVTVRTKSIDPSTIVHQWGGKKY